MRLGRLAALVLPAAAVGITVGVATIPLTANATATAKTTEKTTATATPRSPYALYDCANKPQVRPRTFDIACDGADALTGLKWSSWTGTQAVATGVNWVNNCQPSCAGGKFFKQNVIVVLWRPEPVHGHRGQFGYSKLTLLYPGTGKVQDDVPPGAF